MKPNFALNLTHEAIGLLHRTARGWLAIGEAPLDGGDLTEPLAYLRATALGLAPQGMTCKLILPASQILYTEVAVTATDPDKLRTQVARALEGRTPYPVAELVFDIAGNAPFVQVAVVARETLDEAEDFAAQHRFNPVSFVAIPAEGAFAGEPFFGETRAAPTLTGAGERVARDSEPVRVVTREPARSGRAGKSGARPAAASVPSEPAAEVPAPVAAKPAVATAWMPAPDIAAPPPPTAAVTADPVPEPDLPSGPPPAPPAADRTAVASPPPVQDATTVAAEPPQGRGTDRPADTAADPAPVAAPAPSPSDHGSDAPPAPVRASGRSSAWTMMPLSGRDDAAADPVAQRPAPAAAPAPVAAGATQDALPVPGAEVAAPPSAAAPPPAPAVSARPPTVNAPPPSSSRLPDPPPAFASRRRDDGLRGATPPPLATRSQPAAPQATGPRPGLAPMAVRGAVAPPASASTPAADPLPAAAAGRATPATPARQDVPPEAATAPPGTGLPRPLPSRSDLTTLPPVPFEAGARAPTARPDPKAAPRPRSPAAQAAPQAQAGRRVAGRVPNAPESAGAPARPGAQASPGALGSRAVRPRGKPRYLGLALTGALLLFLALVAAWSSVYLSEDIPADSGDTGVAAAPSGAASPAAPAPVVVTAGEKRAPETDILARADAGAGPADGPAAEAETAPAEPALPPVAAAESPAIAPQPSTEPDTSVTEGVEPAAPPAGTASVPEPLPEPAPPAAVQAANGADPALATAGPIAGQDEIFLSAMDAPPPAFDAAALPASVAAPDGAPRTPAPPPPAGTVYQFDAEGRIVAGETGVVAPGGFWLIAARPPLVPPARPAPAAAEVAAAGTPAAEAAPPVAVPAATAGGDATAVAGSAPAAPAFTADPEFTGSRPRVRPATVEPPAPEPAPPQAAGDDAALPAADPRFVALRPRPRPETVISLAEAARRESAAASLVAEAQASAAAPPARGADTSPLAVALSRRPAARPADFSRAVAAAVAVATQPEPVPPAAAEPELPQPAPVVQVAAQPAPRVRAGRAAPEPEPEPSPQWTEAEADDEPEGPDTAAPRAPLRGTVAKQATFANAINLSKVNLIGIYGTPSNRYAMVRSAAGRFSRVKVGDRVDGGTVAAITGSELRYQKGGRMVTLAMPRS